MTKKNHEILIRILLGILYLLVLDVLFFIMTILWIVQVILVLFTKNTNKDITRVIKLFVDFVKDVFYYLGFVTDDRPFPFEKGKIKKK